MPVLAGRNDFVPVRNFENCLPAACRVVHTCTCKCVCLYLNIIILKNYNYIYIIHYFAVLSHVDLDKIKEETLFHYACLVNQSHL